MSTAAGSGLIEGDPHLDFRGRRRVVRREA